MKQEFPLASRCAVELIAAVLPPSRIPQVSIQHLNPIAGLLYRANMLASESLNSLHVRVRATFKLLERGFDEDSKANARELLDHDPPLSQYCRRAFRQLQRFLSLPSLS